MLKTCWDVGDNQHRVWEDTMKLKETPRRPPTESLPPNLTARQRALLAATGKDRRRGFWAMELLERRDAVARWRGQPGGTIREVIQAINGLPA
jgi:hypothetical protein